MARRRLRLVLDHNFPNSPLLATSYPDVEMLPLRSLHPDLVVDHDDWQVLQQLRARQACECFVTLDANMLSLAKEMVVLHQSRLSLVVIEGTDSDPFVAGGALIAASARIVRSYDGRKPQLFRIKAPTVAPTRPWLQIETIASREGRAADAIVSRERLTRAELFLDCRAGRSPKPTP